jgi:hypothetical protein
VLRERRDDDLVEVLEVDGVLHRGNGIGIADLPLVDLQPLRPELLDRGANMRLRVGTARVHVRRPGHAVRCGGHEQVELHRSLDGAVLQRLEQLGRARRAVGDDEYIGRVGHGSLLL